MSILITGANGYLGKHLVNEFIDINDKVILTKTDDKFVNLNKKFTWKKFNIYENKEEIYNYLEKPKTLIHLVWDGLSLRNYDSNIHVNQINYHYNFIESLVSKGLKNIVIVGTCFEYGNYNGEIDEKFLPKPVTKYGQAKNALRIKLESLKKKYNFNLSWLRLFYFYGGEKNYRDLWGNLNYAIENEKKFFEISEGNQLRDYLHINQVTKYIKIITINNKDYGILNICSNKPISIKNLIYSWKTKYRWKIKIVTNIVTIKKYENNDFWGSNKKLQNILNNN